MTTREKWFMTGLILLGFLLPASLLWQAARYGDAEQALRRVLNLEDRAENGDTAKAILLKEARPHIRQALDRGEPEDAFRRIAVLDEAESANKDEKPEQPIPLDQLWPPNSPERARAQQVLKDFVAKQQAGHELSLAKERLVHVADAVRAGNRDEALRLFGEAADLVKNAPVRPGFEKPGAPATGSPQGAAPGSIPPGEYEAQLAPILGLVRFVTTIQSAPPQMLERVPAAERERAAALLPLVTEIQKAIAEGKDLSALIRLMPRLKAAGDSKKGAEIQRALAEAVSTVRSAPMRPKPPQGAQPAPQPAVAPPPTPPTTPTPTLPPTQPPPPSQQDVEQLLTGFDQMRKIPDVDYQRIRPQLAQMISGLMMRAASANQAASITQTGALVGVGDRKSLRLEMSPTGALTRVLTGLEDVAAGLKPGGVVVSVTNGGTLKLEGPVKPRKSGLTQTVSSDGGRVFTEYVQEGDSLVVRIRAKRQKEGKAADLVLDLPFRAAGWLWDAGGEPQIVRADDTLFWLPVAGADPKPVTLRKGPRGLVFQPGPGASLSYSENRLLLRTPLPTGVGPAEMTLRVSPAAALK